MADALVFNVAPDLTGIIRPVWGVFAAVRVADHDPRLDAPLAEAARAAGSRPEAVEVTAAVRAMYKRVGLDPTKTRPSSEALVRRVRRGEALPRINSLVDVINWCSLESQLPFGLYDLGRLVGAVRLRVGEDGESYPGIRKDVVHVGGRLVLADEAGPFGNPTSDSARTMVTTATTAGLVVIFAPATLPPATGARALERTAARIGEFCRVPSA